MLIRVFVAWLSSWRVGCIRSHVSSVPCAVLLPLNSRVLPPHFYRSARAVEKKLSARRPQRLVLGGGWGIWAFGLGACMGSAGVLPSLVEAGYGIQASTSLIAMVGPKILGAPCVRAGVALQLCCCGTGSQPGTLKSRPPRPGDHRHQPNWAAPWQVSSCTRKGPQVVDFRLRVRVCG